MSPTGGAGRWAAGALVLLGAGALAVTLASAGSLPVAPQRLTAYRSCVLSAFPSSTAAVADAWVDEFLLPGVHPLQLTELHVRSNTGSRRRTYVRFDVTKCNPALPASATVRSAHVRLLTSAVPTADSTYAIRRVTGPCPEGLATCWGDTTITWNNQPGVAAAATGTATVCAAASCNNRYHAWDVTADVAAFLSGATPNHGWQLRDVAEGTTSMNVRFRSRERNVASEDPVLVIVYT